MDKECCATCAYCMYVSKQGLTCFVMEEECGVVTPIIDDEDCCNRYFDVDCCNRYYDEDCCNRYYDEYYEGDCCNQYYEGELK